MFKPLAVDYMKKVLNEIEIMHIKQKVSTQLKNIITKHWKIKFEKIRKQIISEIRAQCLLETKYSTLNNVTKNITKKILYPDSFTYVFREMIVREDYLKKADDGKGKVMAESLEKVKDNLAQKLEEVIARF